MKAMSQVLRTVFDANWNPDTLDVVPPDPNDPIGTVAVGVGCNTFRSHILAQAVDDSKAITNNISYSESAFSSIESVKQLRDALSLDVEVSVSGLVFSASASLSYFEMSEFNSYDFFALATLKIRTESKVLNGGDLTLQARQDARTMSPDEFFRKYGDCFVRRIDYGGELYGLLHVKTQYESQKNSLRSELQVSGGGSSLEVRLATMHEAMSQVGRVDVLFMKTGGTPAFVDNTNFMQQVRGFSAEVIAKPRPLSFIADTYDIVNWPSDANPKADYSLPRKYFGNAQEVAAKCQEKLNDVNYVVANQNPFDFSTVSLQRVQGYVRFLQKTLDEATTKVDEIATTPVTASPLPLVNLSEIILPIRKVISPPNIWTWVGVFGIGQTNGDSGSFAGFAGNPLDAFGIQKIAGQPYDVHFSYSGRFIKLSIFPLGTLGQIVEFRGGDGSGCGATSGAWNLLGISVSLGGKDAYLFDLSYQFRLRNGSLSKVGVNGTWIESTADNPPDGLKVYLRPK